MVTANDLGNDGGDDDGLFCYLILLCNVTMKQERLKTI